MDALNKVLESGAPFLPAATFKGRREGYVFKLGASGLGYYLDHVAQARSSKRGREQYEISAGDEEDEDAGEESGSSSSSSSRKRSVDIERILADADEEEVKALDSHSLKLLLVKFEKKINANQEMRIKHARAPEKYLDSEMELHGVIQELSAVAASPELYSTLLQSDSMTSIMGMVTHDNTDISLASISLLQEMTDAESLEGEEKFAEPLIEAFLGLQGLELVVLNLDRLDESCEEDAQGVFTTLTLIENLVALRPDIATLICERTHLIKFLVKRLLSKSFDGNKLYCSEILSILLQGNEGNQKRFLLLQDIDGVDSLLQSIAQYKKTDPTSLDEAECVQNVFLSLCAVVMLPEGQEQFRAAEGFELMVRCLKEQKFVAAGALKVINFAVLRSRPNCLKLIETGGLRYVFPLLAGVGLGKAYQAGGGSSNGELKITNGMDKRQQIDFAVGIVGQLVLYLHTSTELDSGERLLAKFTENQLDKLARCVELFAKAGKRLQSAERGIQRTLEAAIAAGDEDTVADYGDEDVLYDLRLQGGLFELQQLAFLIAFVYIYFQGCRAAVDAKLTKEGGCIEDLLGVLREWAANVVVEEEGEGDSSSSSSSKSGGVGDSLQRQTLITWCAALSQLALSTS